MWKRLRVMDSEKLKRRQAEAIHTVMLIIWLDQFSQQKFAAFWEKKERKMRLNPFFKNSFIERELIYHTHLGEYNPLVFIIFAGLCNLQIDLVQSPK